MAQKNDCVFDESESNLKVQTILIAKEVEADCPYCNKRQHGFIGNPSGGIFDCDDCNKQFKIHADADIDFQ